MKVFVTGGAGYIGSVTVEMLIDRGHEVVVFDNLERGHREALHPAARFVQGDLRDRAVVEEAVARSGAEAVVHFAAYALVGESMAQPELYFGNNLVGGVNLAAAMLKAGIRKIVFSSTCATYGIPPTNPITEETPQKPTNPYGESKLMFERVLWWYRDLHRFEPVMLRYFNACGATARYGEDHEPETHIIPNVLRVALGQSPEVRMFGDDYRTPDGTCVRDYIHISDLAQAHVRAIEGRFEGAFNLGNGEGYSVRQVVDAARRVTGHAIPAAVSPRRPGDPDRLVADARKAREVLGWRPDHTDLDEIVRSAWEWSRRHPRGYRT